MKLKYLLLTPFFCFIDSNSMHCTRTGCRHITSEKHTFADKPFFECDDRWYRECYCFYNACSRKAIDVGVGEDGTTVIVEMPAYMSDDAIMEYAAARNKRGARRRVAEMTIVKKPLRLPARLFVIR